jgi:hypothetical protein
VALNLLPGLHQEPQVGDGPGQVAGLAELVAPGALGPLHLPLALGGARRGEEELDAWPLALSLELSSQLGSPIHLYRLHREGEALEHLAEEAPGGLGGGPAAGLGHSPAADQVLGGELPDGSPRQGRDRQRLYLHQLARGLGAVALGQGRPFLLLLLDARRRGTGPISPRPFR